MTINAHRQFIKDKLGGPEVAAGKLGRTESAVRMWAHRKSLPRTIWPEILDAYDNVSLDDLRALEGERAV